MLSMVEYVHERMHTYDNLEIGVDFTMGNGHDTKSLIECCKEVYSFDIQEEALIHTRELVGDKAHLIRDSHENFDHYVDTFDIGIFNLGYLLKVIITSQQHLILLKELLLRRLNI